MQGKTHLKRASTEKLREIFDKYASEQVSGEKFMTSEDFVRKFLGLFQDPNYNKVSVRFQFISLQTNLKCFCFGFQESVKYLAYVADTNKDGLISFGEFQAFEGILCAPDALYKTAFQLFDTNGNGAVSFCK